VVDPDAFRPGRPPARVLPRIALASCRDFPSGDDDGPLLLAACARAGLDASWRVWDDPAVDWLSFDLVVLRSTWDYPAHRDEFLRWVEAVPRLANPADVVRWNTDKAYLRDLAAAGLPVVPTTWFQPGDDVRLPADGEWVVKPAVSAGARDTARYRPEHRELAIRHIDRLLAEGRRVMVQPYLHAVDEAGETALLYCGGGYSHGIGKAALLTGPDPDVDGLYRPEEISAREPDAAEREVAERVLASVPGGPDRLLYARVDLVPGSDGPLLLELELTEPSFFLQVAPDAADRFADAIAAWVATGVTTPHVPLPGEQLRRG
jgi:glutathione synthase/RimK-type ligase-like ATP-grasp enzyme